MDTPTVRFADLTPENADVAGLNGRPAGHCGYALPLVRHKPTGLYCALSLASGGDPVWTSDREIRELDAAERVTLFSKPLPLPSDSTGEKARQPVVAWFSCVAREFLGALRSEVEKTRWISVGSAEMRVVSASLDDVEKELAGVATRAQAGFDGKLASPMPNWAELSDISEVLLQATRDRDRRFWAYVRRALVLCSRPDSPPELAIQLFRGAVAPAYAGVTWDQFLGEMLAIKQIIRLFRPAVTRGSQPHSAIHPAYFVPPEFRGSADLRRADEMMWADSPYSAEIMRAYETIAELVERNRPIFTRWLIRTTSK